MAQTKRHNVFVSYHHADQTHKEKFVRMMGNRIIDKSVSTDYERIYGSDPPTEPTLQSIREDYIASASVTVVLIGQCTWQRRYVDWEIASSLRDTPTNPRCGLLGILLPGHPNYETRNYNPRLIPPRLVDNCGGNDPYARIYKWPTPWSVADIVEWIHNAFRRRKENPPPNNRQDRFRRNRSGDCLRGWQN